MSQAEMKSPDMVNNPAHYTKGGIEVIKVLEAKLTREQFEGFLIGNLLKYSMRSNYKGKHVEDLKKARWYLDRLITTIETIEK
jgi:hypothetical protein